jgi:hypothetical protein
MHRNTLPISALPAWAKLNDVTFYDTKVQQLPGKGFALVADKRLTSVDTFDRPTLLSIPRDLILSAEAVEEHAKADKDFRKLLDLSGGKVRSNLGVLLKEWYS